MAESWSTGKSRDIYSMDSWGDGYFQINPEGFLEICPLGSSQQKINLHSLMEELEERGLSTPVIVRFCEVIQSRIEKLNSYFQNAIKENGYKGQYRGVYPIKVNQQGQIVREILKKGAPFNLGLECGSKPELLIALSLMENPDAAIICNGFKDREYIEMSLLAQKINKKTILVVERKEELETIISVSKTLNLEPSIGFRVKLHASSKGNWGESTGMNSKFGLTSTEIVGCLESLEKAGLMGALKLLHFHIGSQVPSIQHIKNAVKEGVRFYVELKKKAPKLEYLDVGGGLGVNYEAPQNLDSKNSLNYTPQEYANDVIFITQSICDEKDTEHPHIITESGRFLVAHSSILITDVIGHQNKSSEDIGFTVNAKDPQIAKELLEIYTDVNEKNFHEFYNDLVEKKRDILQMFTYGVLSLQERGRAEKLYQAISRKMIRIGKGLLGAEEICYELESQMSSIYFCNFSLFQSLPDSWALNQVFPIMPLQRLHERPNCRAVLADLTCDSDGRINRFIDSETKEVQKYLEVHELKKDEPYYIGFFLTGAYQEVLGDLHNLFGDTNTVQISIHEDGTYSLNDVAKEDSVSKVLDYVRYQEHELFERVRKDCEKSIRERRVSVKEIQIFLKQYEKSLRGSPYLISSKKPDSYTVYQDPKQEDSDDKLSTEETAR